MSDGHEGELARAREQYLRRDEAGAAEWSWGDPEYVWWIQDLERQFLRVLAHMDVILPSAEVLDVGAGAGYFANRISEYGAARVTGLDLSSERVEAARRRYATLEFVSASATSMPFEEARFDLVTQFMCLSSVFDPGARRAICAEIRRITKPEGVFVSFDLRPRPVVRRISRRLRGEPDSPVEQVSPVARRELEAGLELRASVVRNVAFPLEARSLVRRVPVLAAHFPLPVHQLVAFRVP